jgi:hypothetical protein
MYDDYYDCDCIPSWARDITLTELFAKCKELSRFIAKYHLEEIQKDLEKYEKIFAGLDELHHEFYGEKNFPHLDTNQKYINQKLFDLVDSVIPFPKEPIRVITPSRFDKELKELYLPSIKKAIEDVPRAFTNLYKGAEIDGE